MNRQLKLEKGRLEFIEERDGLYCAAAFACQTMKLYRQHVLKSSGWLNRKVRKSFIESYLDFKAYYLEYKYRIYGK